MIPTPSERQFAVKSTAIILLIIGSVPVLIGGSGYAESPVDDSDLNTFSSSGDVSASSGSNRFVVWMDNTGNTVGNNEILLRRSTDNGATWKPTVNLSKNPGESEFPRIAVSGPNVYVIWNQHNADNSLVDVFLRQSTDNGATWKPFVNISNNNPGRSFEPQIAVSGPNVYVIWTDTTPGNGDILLRRSTDNGATWKSIFNVSKNPGGSFGPQVTASGTSLYVVWVDDTPGNREILFRLSTDNGATWKTVKNLSSNANRSSDPLIAFSGANLYVAWTNGIGHEEIFFRHSADGGISWKPLKNLNPNFGLDQLSLSQLVASGSNVYLAWSEVDDNAGPIGAFLRRSTDNGVTWGPTIGFGESTFGGGPRIVVSGSNVYLVYGEFVDNSMDVIFRLSTDGGATWKPPKNLANDAETSVPAQIAFSGGNVYVIWLEGYPGNNDIFLRRSTDNGSSWKPENNLSNNAGESKDPQIGL